MAWVCVSGETYENVNETRIYFYIFLEAFWISGGTSMN